MSDESRDLRGFTVRVGVVVLFVGVLTALAVLLWQISTTVLIVFGAVLFAVFLNGLARLLVHYAKVPRYGVALALAVVILLALAVGTALIVGPRVADQFDQLTQRIPQAVQQLEERISSYEWGQFVLSQAPDPSQAAAQAQQGRFGGFTGSFSRLADVLVNVAILIVVGLYLAAAPGLYTRGVLHLVPSGRRRRAAEVLDRMGYALRYWLLGRFASMTVVGVLTALGLWLIGVPLALTLGLIAAVFSFVPNIGPLLSVIPALVVGLMEAPVYGLYVAALYAGVQTVESYLITPLIQQRAVSIPPALLITAQVVMGVLFGILGLFLATPLTVTLMVVIQMLYVRDTLGDEVSVMGPDG